MAKFKVNTDTLQETINAYQTAIFDIEQAIKDAESNTSIYGYNVVKLIQLFSFFGCHYNFGIGCRKKFYQFAFGYICIVVWIL